LTDDSYTIYQVLVERVEAFAQTVRQRHGEHINCKAGCDSCCYQTFTIFPVEAEHMARAIAGLSQAERRRLKAHLDVAPDAFKMAEAVQPCVLLVQGRCMLYSGRPLICRLHGYPLYSAMVERPDGSLRDCCPLNFSTLPLPLLESESIFNLDLVNQTLAAINHQFVQEHRLTGERLSIGHVVMRTLSES
jgi:hypothetical protein